TRSQYDNSPPAADERWGENVDALSDRDFRRRFLTTVARALENKGRKLDAGSCESSALKEANDSHSRPRVLETEAQMRRADHAEVPPIGKPFENFRRILFRRVAVQSSGHEEGGDTRSDVLSKLGRQRQDAPGTTDPLVRKIRDVPEYG